LDLLRETLSINLLKLRKQFGFTQAAISEKLNITTATYNRWENGSNWPDPNTLERLAEVYGIRSTLFFHDPDLEQPPERNTLSKKEIKARLIELIDMIQ
jgi:transcriptional regulator with XRE-family HTH domain